MQILARMKVQYFETRTGRVFMWGVLAGGVGVCVCVCRRAIPVQLWKLKVAYRYNFQLCTGTTLFSTTLYRYNFVFNFAFSPTTLKPFSSQPTLSGPRVSCQGHVEWRNIRFLLSFLFSGALCSFQRRDIELYCNPPSFFPHLQASFVRKCKLVFVTAECTVTFRAIYGGAIPLQYKTWNFV